VSEDGAVATQQLEAEIARQLGEDGVTPVEVLELAMRCAMLSAGLLSGYLGDEGPEDILRATRFAHLCREAREWLDLRADALS